MRFGVVIIVLSLLIVGCSDKNEGLSTQDIIEYAEGYESDSLNPETPYSGEIFPIETDEYRRYLVIESVQEEEIKRNLAEYANLTQGDYVGDRSFIIFKSGDWSVVRFPGEVSFYDYHDLISWFSGYELDGRSLLAFGMAVHETNSSLNYVFELDPDIEYGDTVIGSFENGNVFFIYTPGGYVEGGNLTLSEDVAYNSAKLDSIILENQLEEQFLHTYDSSEIVIKFFE